MIYHIMKAEEWVIARHQSAYTPIAFEQDGFIHLCELDQVEGVVNRYFLDQKDLVALCIASQALTAALRYEDLLGEGELFPHLYGPLNLDAVRKIIYFQPEVDPNTGGFSMAALRSRLLG